MDKSKKQDIIILVLLPIIATHISLLFRTNFLISSLLFFGIPSLYLSLISPKEIKKIFFFSLIFSIPLGFILDYFAVKDLSWHVPQTIFPFRIFGLIPIEDLIWGFLTIYFICSFYEYFLDKKIKKKQNKNLKYLISFLFLAIIIFYFITQNMPSFSIPYFYLWMGILLALFPIVLFLFNFPQFFFRYTKLIIYFFSVFFLSEITGLRLNQWEFPGNHFIGMVDILGLTFPFEEFIFFIVLFSVAIISWYEFFADDKK